MARASEKNVLYAFVKHKRKFGLEKSDGLKNGQTTSKTPGILSNLKICRMANKQMAVDECTRPPWFKVKALAVVVLCYVIP